MDGYPITIFHDGECPVCRLDIANLQSRNAAGHLRFIDIAAADFDPAVYGRTQAEFAAEIHAQLPDGTLITGMEVFRRAYRAVGLGWLIAPADWGPLRTPADAFYRLFARHRPLISRCFGGLFTALAAWQAERRGRACRSGQCRIPHRD